MPSAANRQGIVGEFHIVWRVVTLFITIQQYGKMVPAIVNKLAIVLVLCCYSCRVTRVTALLQWGGGGGGNISGA